MKKYMWAVIATVSTAALLLVALISSSAFAAPGDPVTVNVELQAHNNSILDIPANGSASYYANGWHEITAGQPEQPQHCAG